MNVNVSRSAAGIIGSLVVGAASLSPAMGSTSDQKDYRAPESRPAPASRAPEYRAPEYHPAPAYRPAAPDRGSMYGFGQRNSYQPAPSYQPASRPAPVYRAPSTSTYAPDRGSVYGFGARGGYRGGFDGNTSQSQRQSPVVQYQSSARLPSASASYRDPQVQIGGGVPDTSTLPQQSHPHLFGGTLGHGGSNWGGHYNPQAGTSGGYSSPGDHITLPPAPPSSPNVIISQPNPNIIISQPNLYRRPHHHHDDDDTVIVNNYPYGYNPYSYSPYGYNPYPVSYPPYYPCYPNTGPTVIYAPDPRPEVVYVPQEPQVVYVPQQPDVVYVPEPQQPQVVYVPQSEPTTTSAPAPSEPPVIVIQGGTAQDTPGPVDDSSVDSTVDGRAASALPISAKKAIVDIQEAWVLADDSLVRRHVDTAHPIRMYKDGKLDYTSSTDQYLKLTKKALEALVTESFSLDHRSLLPDGRVRAYGTHVFVDPNNHRQANSVCYWLQLIGDRWIITAINTTAVAPPPPAPASTDVPSSVDNSPGR